MGHVKCKGKMQNYVNVKCKTLKLLEDNIGENLSNLESGTDHTTHGNPPKTR